MARNCNMKFARSEPYMNPNNFDISFQINEVPSNVEIESATNLEKRLQKVMPLTKKIHLNIEAGNMRQNNIINISSILKINGKEVKFI